jgi:hypothetical protein
VLKEVDFLPKKKPVKSTFETLNTMAKYSNMKYHHTFMKQVGISQNYKCHNATLKVQQNKKCFMYSVSPH